MVLAFFGTIAASVLTVIVSVAMSILSFGFECCHSGYLYLYDICQDDIDDLQSSDKPKIRFACIFWYFVYGLHQACVFLFSMMFPLSLIASLVFVGYSLFSVHHAIQGTFGIGIFSYLKLFPTTNVVFTVLYFVLIVIAVVVVLISLGSEWSEWGQTLKSVALGTGGNWEEFLHQAAPADDVNIAFSAGQSQQHCQQFMEILNGLFDNCELIYEQVVTASQQEEDSNLQYSFAEYLDTLKQIRKKLSSVSGVMSCNTFEKNIIPLIQVAQRQEKELQKDVLHILQKHNNAAKKGNSELDFFSGCTTLEGLQSRYRALCKIYHPDVGGHTETFQMLQAQYEQRRNEMESDTKTKQQFDGYA